MTRGSSFVAPMLRFSCVNDMWLLAYYRIHMIFTFLIRDICISCYRRVYIDNKGTACITRVCICGRVRSYNHHFII